MNLDLNEMASRCLPCRYFINFCSFRIRTLNHCVMSLYAEPLHLCAGSFTFKKIKNWSSPGFFITKARRILVAG